MKAVPKPKKNKGVRTGTLDKLVADDVKLRSGGFCKRCGKQVGISQLQAAHIIPRVHLLTRWNLKNVYALCKVCHKTIDDNPLEKAEFSFTVLSKQDIKELSRLGNLFAKDHPIDREEIKRNLKSEILKLEQD